ncbi:MAG TPA: DUF4136 domain-containing protein [Cyclobacteriaceae bacterium]|jgi:hypothetical protein|nr:DUF4136 domain-containing protein [Cyclobacteriaceae bacterium]
MKKWIITCTAFATLLLSCQPKPNDADLVRNLLVLTSNYNSSINYSSYTTYGLATDTVSFFYNQDPDPKDTLQCSSCTGNNNALGSYPTTITNEIKYKLDSAGFKQVGWKQNPDLKIYVAIVENYSLYQSYSYYPYGYGFGGYYGGYGYYGGGYIPTVNASDQADLYIQIYDLKNKTGGNPTALWGAVITDLVTSPSASITTRAIKRAFDQSKYISK